MRRVTRRIEATAFFPTDLALLKKEEIRLRTAFTERDLGFIIYSIAIYT